MANKDLSQETIRKKESALEYAGVDARISGYKDKKWTIEQVQQHLRCLCTTGYDLKAHSSRERNPALYRAALHYFGSWRAALSVSGINLSNASRRRPKNFDRDTMVLWLKERQAAGQTLVWTEVCLENRAYALAIRRTFRSWRKALVAAGLTDPE